MRGLVPAPLPPRPCPRQLVVLALVIPYAWAILWVLLLGHTPQTPMQPFRPVPALRALLALPGHSVLAACAVW